MNGAESLIKTLVAAGVDVCFANPGTTEMPFVRAFDETEGMRAVLCLFEGVCTGAADGYARMAGKPGLTLLHLGPGFANGIAYLHDARRARSPIINLIGDHATWHLEADAPLTSDIESLASPVSAWVRRNRSSEELAGDAVDAIEAASIKPGNIATLIVPHDCQLEPAGGIGALRGIPSPPRVDSDLIEKAVAMLESGEPTVLFLGGMALQERGLKAAARIALAVNCRLMCETFPARWERGVGLPVIERLPYFPEHAMAALAPYKNVILAGARSPVAFFGYPGLPSWFVKPEQYSLALAAPEDDVVDALDRLADRLGVPAESETNIALQVPPRPSGPLTSETLSAAVAAVMPENTILMDEGNTSTGPFGVLSQSGPRHSYLTQPGGAIGLGMPCATGAAIACPDRPVITFQADGSAMYTLQALWTQARENLNVITIICNNRSYRILGLELLRAGVKEFGPQARGLIGLDSPALDWVSLARGMGVPATRADRAEDLVSQLERALNDGGPRVIEAVIQS
ncbi:MAG: acetolactate synthase large subunit [Acidobacteriota bacterium]|nr:MAG: acetolactate synthase large subunit [Acidobacteriota bacterium]